MDALRASHGAIVNVSSLRACERRFFDSLRGSKAAVNHMTALLRQSLGPEVRVNAVAPDSSTRRGPRTGRPCADTCGAVAPLKRSGTPEDVADVIVALASSAYVTGQVVVVDGGLGLAT